MNLKEPFMNDKTPQFVSTATAARMLGLSTTLVQTLVDKNELDGWKTRGGHRRIAMQSIIDYRSHSHSAIVGTSHMRSTPHVMVAIETPTLLQRLDQHCRNWNFPIKLNFNSSITEALLNLGSERPDLLVVEMGMPRAEQEKTLSALENFNTKGRPVSMVLVTEESQLRPSADPRGKLIQLVPGPLTEVWMHAYLTGVVASCRT